MNDHPLKIESQCKPPKKGVSLFGTERLAYPICLLNSANVIQYPLNEKGFVYFNCYLNREKKCCEVRDECSMYALYQHGYFGKGSLSSNGPVHQVVNEMAKSKKNRKQKVIEPQLDPHQKLREAFPYLPDKEEIINNLYQSPSDFDSGKKESNRDLEISLDRILFSGGLEENLRLGLEETFFLSYALGCMTVTDSEANCKLNLRQIWSTFCQLHCEKDHVQFTSYYAAYHYFRSKGWVVKSGIKYGSDFVLYKEGPEFYHSLFSVIVYTIKSNEDIADKHPHQDWLSMSSWIRVNEGVLKCPVMCIVVIPFDLQPKEFTDPRVIQKYSIKVCKKQASINLLFLLFCTFFRQF